nr:O-antigen ligase family protein [Bacteroidota bacterium]
MKNKQSREPIPSKKKVKNTLKPSYYILLMAYALVPVFIQNFDTWDSNGPKFLAIAFLNLISFVIFVNDPQFTRRPEIRSGFFRNLIGLTYTLFLLISLLSFFNAINLTESVLNFSKTLTVYLSAYVLFVIFKSNRGYLLHLTVALTILLLFDCLTVFYNMILYISRDVSSIMDIKSVYSHKNILASALFVKIPFALYLMFFSSGWQRRLGYFAGLSAILATLLLSTRAFYLGLALLLVALFIYALLRQTVVKKKGYLLSVARWAGLFILAVVLYTMAQQFLFPKNTDTIWNTGIVSRLSSIKADESSTSARLRAWKWSTQLIGENPVLGVGTGNWKIAVLKHENKTSPDFLYAYKNHNDFLEITAETGLLGGLTYIALFTLILFSFIKVSLKSLTNEDGLKLLFLCAFGILAYSVDAFFNFPADRPEIQLLLAIYIALAATYPKFEIQPKLADHPSRFRLLFRKSYINKLVAAFVCILLIVCCWILILNVQSLYYQRRYIEDKRLKAPKHQASYFVKGFPSIPSVNSFGSPIAVLKADYLI